MIKLLKTISGIPAGTTGHVIGETKATGFLTLRFNRPGHLTEVLTNVSPDDVEGDKVQDHDSD